MEEARGVRELKKGQCPWVERMRGCEIGKGWPEWALALEL